MYIYTHTYIHIYYTYIYIYIHTHIVFIHDTLTVWSQISITSHTDLQFKTLALFLPEVLRIIRSYLNSILECGNKERESSVSQYTCNPKRNYLLFRFTFGGRGRCQKEITMVCE